MTLDDLARAMYEECPTVKPRWDDLQEVTKSVWRDYVLANKDLF
jgi:hypothetical protein